MQNRWDEVREHTNRLYSGAIHKQRTFMSDQNFKSHARFHPPFHFVSAPIALLTLIGAGVNVYESWGAATQYSASLIFVLAFLVFMAITLARAYALKAQDRVIRAEENLRAYVRTGSMLDSRLSIRQIIGLRFASDEEFDALAARAVAENMSEKDIKASIKNWRADTYRV